MNGFPSPIVRNHVCDDETHETRSTIWNSATYSLKKLWLFVSLAECLTIKIFLYIICFTHRAIKTRWLRYQNCPRAPSTLQTPPYSARRATSYRFTPNTNSKPTSWVARTFPWLCGCRNSGGTLTGRRSHREDVIINVCMCVMCAYIYICLNIIYKVILKKGYKISLLC